MHKPEFLKITQDLIVRFDRIESVEYGVETPSGTHDAIVRMSRALTLYKDGRAKKDVVIHFLLDGPPAKALRAFFDGKLWNDPQNSENGFPYGGYDGFTFDLAKAYREYLGRSGQTEYEEPQESPEPAPTEKPRVNREAIRERLKEVQV